MSDQDGSGIEQIPVELWHQIFQYYALNGLWYSFRRLNSRIDAIIDQTPLHLDFRRRGAYARYVKNINPSMNPTNMANVRSLIMKEPEEIRHFLSIHPLKTLAQLRTLMLTNISSSDDPAFQFRNQLSSLKHLQSLNVSFTKFSNHRTSHEEKEFLICSVFVHGFYPELRRFSIDTASLWKGTSAIRLLNQTTKASNLRYLSIDSLTFGDLVILLPAMENIVSLRVSADLDAKKKSIEKPPEIDKPLLPSCHKLELTLDDNLKFEHVEYLLGQKPNLKSLFVWGWSHLNNAKKWELVLPKYCPQLLKLELICTGYNRDDVFYDAIEDFDQECRTNPFWLERNATADDRVRSTQEYCCDLTVRFDIRRRWIVDFLY